MYSRISSDTSVRLLLAWANSPKVATVTAILSNRRQYLRRQNPEVEVYGEMFYDWQPMKAEGAVQSVSSVKTGWRY
jgi:hypothetical protein